MNRLEKVSHIVSLEEIDNIVVHLSRNIEPDISKLIFRLYLNNEQIGNDYLLSKAQEAFGNLSKEDIKLLIMKYALVKSFDEENTQENKIFKTIYKMLNQNKWQKTRESQKGIVLNGKEQKLIDIPSDKKTYLQDSISNIFNEQDLMKVLVTAFLETRYKVVDDKITVNNSYNPDSELITPEVSEYISYLTPTGKGNDNLSIVNRIRRFSEAKKLYNQRFTFKGYNHIGKDLFASFNQKTSGKGTLLSKHHDNSDFKLIAISESKNSEDANYALQRIQEWFDNIDSEFYSREKELEILINNLLSRINYELKDKSIKAKMAIAVVGKDKTFTASFGNASSYVLKESIALRREPNTKELGSINNDEIIINVLPNNYTNIVLLGELATQTLGRNYLENELLSRPDESIREFVEKASEDSSVAMIRK